MLRSLWNKYSQFLFPLLLATSILWRLFGSYTFPAQIYDIGTYQAWGKIMLEKGPAEFFRSTWSDYLPLPIYFCALIVLISDALKANFALIFKLAISLLEIISLVAIYKSISSRLKYLLLPFLFFSPALIGDSAYWGQLDTIPALLTVLSLILLPRENILPAALAFGLAVAIKPILLITLPVFLLIFLSRRSFVSFLFFSAVSFLTFLLPALPVGGNPLLFLLGKALEQSSTYPYTTINGWNFWSLIPLNNTWPPDNYSILSLSAHSLGLVLFGFFTLILLNHWRRAQWDAKYAFRLAGTLLVLFYTFMTRMHERHLLFGLPFLAVAALTQTWLALPLSLLTITFTLNLWAAYSWVNHSQTWPVTEGFIQVVSYLNVTVALLLATVWDWPRFLKSLIINLKSHKLLIGILLLAAFLRFYNLGYPNSYIFDEVYHSFTARELIHNNIAAWEWWTTPPPGVAYEWTHPPVAKYGMVIGMLIFGENSFGWRVGSAVFGLVSILGLYHLTLAVFGKKKLALLTALLVSLEGLHVSQSRVGMNDIYMLAFLIWSLYLAVKGRWKGSALLFGLSLASKWSAVYGLLPLSFIYLHQIWPPQINLRLLLHLFSVLRLLLIAAIVYVLTFIPFLTAGHTWSQWWELHKQMWYYHTHLVATHAYQSTPYQWIFSLRPVWYFVQYGENISNIYAQGNPAILWLGLAAFLLLLPRLLRFRYALFFILYSVFTVPWLFSPRIMFFYHYLPSATFLTVILAAWLSGLPKKTILLTLILLSTVYLLISPVIHGFPMPPLYWGTLFKIFPSWK